MPRWSIITTLSHLLPNHAVINWLSWRVILIDIPESIKNTIESIKSAAFANFHVKLNLKTLTTTVSVQGMSKLSSENPKAKWNACNAYYTTDEQVEHWKITPQCRHNCCIVAATRHIFQNNMNGNTRFRCLNIYECTVHTLPNYNMINAGATTPHNNLWTPA